MTENDENTIWGIHAGRTGDAETLFLKKNFVALGWDDVGDLSKIAADREAFKVRVSATYPDKSPPAVANNAGQLYRFVHEMKAGDLVVFPSKSDRRVNIGRIAGDYRYDPATDDAYPNMRKVEWLKSLPRTHFTQGALFEIGSAISLFQIRTYADEFIAAIEGKPAPAAPVEKDATIAAVAQDIEETTKDFVLKTLARETKGLAFEEVILHLLECMGYHARLTRRNEPSVDLIAHKDHLGLEPPIIKVQVKSGEGVATDKDVSALYGKLSPGEYGLFVTLGSCSPQSRNFEQSKANLRIIDGEELVDLIFEHYERFDSRHKGLLPLRRVYVPEPVEVGEE